MTDTHHAHEQIDAAGRDLLQSWRDVTDRWRDLGARRFEAEIIDPLGYEHRDLLNAVASTENVLTAADQFLRTLGDAN